MNFYLKGIGACCVMAASILMGRQTDRGMKHTCMLLQEMYDLLAFLEKEMTFHCAPVPEALRTAARQCSTELSDVLNRAADGTDRREGRIFADIWKEAIENGISPRRLTEETKAAFLEAAEALCNTDPVTQRTMLQKHAERFRNLYQRELRCYQEKSTLVRRLSASAGIFLIILLF